MSTINVSNISDGIDTVGTSYVLNGSAKGWVNYKGTTTNTVRDSLNVSSVTDNAHGRYTTNLTSSFASTNYATTGYVRRDSDTASSGMILTSDSSGIKTASTFKVKVLFLDSGGSTGLTDSPEVGQEFLGDLA